MVIFFVVASACCHGNSFLSRNQVSNLLAHNHCSPHLPAYLSSLDTILSRMPSRQRDRARRVLRALIGKAKQYLESKKQKDQRARPKISAPIPPDAIATKKDRQLPGDNAPPTAAAPEGRGGQYRVASASQLNGRHIEHALREPRSQSLRSRHTAPPIAPLLQRSNSSPHLSASTPTSQQTKTDTDERIDSPAPYSPQLSTIFETAEPVSPIRSPVHVLRAREIPLLPGSMPDFEGKIARFAANAA